MIDTPTDADDFGLGIGDPRDGRGLDHSSLQAKPGINPDSASGLPDGSAPETYRRRGPNGPSDRVNDPSHLRKTPTDPPHDVTSPQNMSELPGAPRMEHDEHYNLGEGDMFTVEDLNTPKLDQISDPWVRKTSSQIRGLAALVRGS